MSSKKVPTSIYYFASTHWDREWYLPFQAFRSRLVDIIDNILETLEQNTSFTQFILDGQTVLLEDYLDIQTKNRSRISNLLDSGRLLAGPWYTMPDENLVSGESIIRNLLIGHEVVASLSKKASVLSLGYLCDCFGHIAQMPQILNGFHISSALVGRGTNKSTCPSFFLWESPDKSRCITYKVPESCGYGTFFYDVYAPSIPEGVCHEKEIFSRAISYVKKELQRSPLPFVLLMDGMDHTPIHPEAPRLLQHLKEHFSCQVHLGNIEQLFDEILQSLEAEKDILPVLRGELQQTAMDMEEHNRLIPGTLSSRYDLKLQNDTIQTLLEKASLPLAALSSLAGFVIPEGYIDTAYRYLLKNHAHDSICGCSIDEVHRDMHYRFRQADLIGREICDIALNHLAHLGEGSLQSDDCNTLKLSVFHTLPCPSTREVNVTLWMPENYPCKFGEMISSEPVNQFRLTNSKGTDIPYQIRHIEKYSTVRAPRAFYGSRMDCYHITFTASLPALGYTEYKVIPSDKPVRFFDSLRTSDYTAENNFLILKIKPDGAIQLTDKRTRYVYDDLLHFKDNGETGDGWTHRPPVPDRTILNASAISIECTSDGPCACTFCITHIMHIPKQTEYHRQYTVRAQSRHPITLKTYITLSRNAACLKCSTEVTNNCKDHRLLLSLRTGIHSSTYASEQAFAFVQRSVDRDPVTHNWKEADNTGKSFSHIVYHKRPDGTGFAFLSGGGLHECAALNQKDGQLDICLFRSFEKTFLTNGQTDGQLQGDLTFSYALVPFSQDMTNAKLIRMKDELQVPVFTFTTPVKTEYLPHQSADSFFLNKNLACISLIEPGRKLPGSIAVRLVNYSDQTIRDSLTCPLPLISAQKTDLLQEPLAPVAFQNNTLNITLSPFQIQTYLLEFENTRRLP